MKLKVSVIVFILTSVLLLSFATGSTYSVNNSGGELKDNINDISVLDMKNQAVNLSDYNDKVLIIVNVASECGYTPQYKGLEEIYKKFNSRGFEVLAFPCNDFGEQEPGTNEQIQQFCSANYGVTFKLFNKIKVLGENKEPLYERLTNNSVTENSDIKWNFEKFLISKDGKIVARFKTKVEPTSKEVVDAIEQQLMQ
ncbi:MAG TPA: glutathione peroxidase [Ignavibacteriaceae bacterium]|nr:glutathione peroxidase [Ignavibacteriaceae bacterium]